MPGGTKIRSQSRPPTIRRYLCTALQWTVVRTRFVPMISEKNQRKRGIRKNVNRHK